VAKDTYPVIGARCGTGRPADNRHFAVLAPHLAVLSFPRAVQSGSTVKGSVTLNGRAGPGGVRVAMDGIVYISSLPAVVLVPAGETSATFAVSFEKVTQQVTGQFTASAGGWKLAAHFEILP